MGAKVVQSTATRKSATRLGRRRGGKLLVGEGGAEEGFEGFGVGGREGGGFREQRRFGGGRGRGGGEGGAGGEEDGGKTQACVGEGGSRLPVLPPVQKNQKDAN